MIFLNKNNWQLPETYTEVQEPLIVVCEQNWGIKPGLQPRSELKGIETVRYLRRVKKVRNPVVFISFLPLELILRKTGSQILTAVGHQFLRLPYHPEELTNLFNKCQPLNDFQLGDIISNFCGERSAFSEAFHAYKNKLRALLNQSVEDPKSEKDFIREEIGAFGKFLSEQFYPYSGIFQTYNQAIQSFPDDSILQAKEFINQTDNLYVKFIPAEQDEPEEIAPSKRAWRVLFLEDEPASIAHVLNEFKKRELSYVVCQNVEDAKKEIESDGNNEITVVISDFRLMESPSAEWPSGRMQSEQGYDFLYWMTIQKRYNALIALSGLSRQFLTDSFRKQQLDIKVYSKNELDSGAKLFVDDIEYLGDHYFDLVVHQPDWKKDGEIYRTFRLSNNFQAKEKDISQRAFTACKDIYATVFHSQNIDGLVFNLLSEYGNAQQNFTENDTDEEKEEKLITKLVLRRIALYCLSIGLNKDITAALINWGNTTKNISDSNSKQVYIKLYIKTASDIPHRILSEERRWLQQEMGIPIYEMSQLLDAALPILNQFLENIVNSKPQKSFSIAKDYLDSQGRISCVSISQLKALVNKLLKQDNDLNFRDQIGDIVDELMVLIPNNKELKSLKKDIEKTS
jgi:hypothetical protein